MTERSMFHVKPRVLEIPALRQLVTDAELEDYLQRVSQANHYLRAHGHHRPPQPKRELKVFKVFTVEDDG